MSVSTYDLENYSQAGFMPFNNVDEFSTISAQVKPGQDYPTLPSAVQKAPFNFNGRIKIPELPILPEQLFTVAVQGNTMTIRSDSVALWPVFSFEFELQPETQGYRAKDFSIVFSDESLDGCILYTRLILALTKSKTFSIQIKSATGYKEENELQIEGYQLLSQAEEKTMIKLASLCRKLKFIQEVFRRVKLVLPNNISSHDSRMVELLYRGITEGEFNSRDSDLTFKAIRLSEDDLKKPPFTQPGLFSHKVRPDISLLGKKFLVGSVVTIVEKAALSSPNVFKEVANHPNKPVDVRFEVLDNLVRYRFETYAQKSKKERTQKLKLFKQKLSHEEPQWIVDLIDESLQNDVSAEEAIQITVGWQQYNDLPDRFCPQEPVLDEVNNCWRVPICLVYSGVASKPVIELVIDLKTGRIIEPIPIEEIYSKGKIIAEEMLHAR